VYDPVLIAATKQSPTYHIKTFNYKALRVCLYKYVGPPDIVVFWWPLTRRFFRLNPRKHYAKWGKEPSHTDASESKSETYDYLGYVQAVRGHIPPDA
jgi:hypothetical protein